MAKTSRARGRLVFYAVGSLSLILLVAGGFLLRHELHAVYLHHELRRKPELLESYLLEPELDPPRTLALQRYLGEDEGRTRLLDHFIGELIASRSQIERVLTTQPITIFSYDLATRHGARIRHRWSNTARAQGCYYGIPATEVARRSESALRQVRGLAIRSERLPGRIFIVQPAEEHPVVPRFFPPPEHYELGLTCFGFTPPPGSPLASGELPARPFTTSELVELLEEAVDRAVEEGTLKIVPATKKVAVNGEVD